MQNEMIPVSYLFSPTMWASRSQWELLFHFRIVKFYFPSQLDVTHCLLFDLLKIVSGDTLWIWISKVLFTENANARKVICTLCSVAEKKQ